jgi:hypothetical protein
MHFAVTSVQLSTQLSGKTKSVSSLEEFDPNYPESNPPFSCPLVRYLQFAHAIP